MSLSRLQHGFRASATTGVSQRCPRVVIPAAYPQPDAQTPPTETAPGQQLPAQPRSLTGLERVRLVALAAAAAAALVSERISCDPAKPGLGAVQLAWRR